MTWHCNWSEDCDWFAERIETVLGTKCLSVVVLVLGLMLRVLVAVVAVTLALRRTCASLDIRAEEEVAFMLENMDSWRRGPAVRNFLQPHLELLATPRP